MENYVDFVNNIYDERSDFIIIGLTGRTGSGCSKVANILSYEKFGELQLREPKTIDFLNSEERKYNILYNYLESNWDKFFIIQMKDIIASFLYERTYDDFITYIKTLNENSECEIVEDQKLENDLGSIKNKFDTKLPSKNDIGNEEQYYNSFKLISEYAEILKSILSKYIYLQPIKDKDKDKTNEYKKDSNNNLIKTQSNLYTYLFQMFGNNIRAYGNPYAKPEKDEIDSKNIFNLAERTKTLIKKYREYQRTLNEKNKDNKDWRTLRTLICIDAIRNPYEATYFKDRFAAFYLFSINTDDCYRIERLSHHLGEEEIRSLDDQEYPKKPSNEQKIFHQNIKKCIELSDIHIHNPNRPDNTLYYLTEQIIKYVTLMKHPGLITPTRIERCMQVAYNAKLNSGCISRQVGAVITDENYSIKAIGWNDVPEGQVPCNLRDINSFCQNKDSDSYSFFEVTDNSFNEILDKANKALINKPLNGRKYPYCFKDVYNSIEDNRNQVHTRSLHAEENAFLQITKYGGQGIKGGNLFTTASSCVLCSKKAFQLGIKKIYYIDPYPDIAESHILNFGTDKSKKPEMILFCGAIGSAYTNLYMQRISYKDELSLLSGLNFREIMEKL